MALLLIQAGADINELGRVRRTTGEFTELSPLLIAAEQGLTELTDLLLAYEPYTYSSNTATTPLQYAVHHRLYNAAEALLERGINPNQAPGNGRTRPPLIMAAMRGDFEMTRILLDYGATVNIEVYPGSGITALAFAARERHTAVVKELLERGANPNIQDTTGRTPLHLAAHQGNTTLVHLLVNHPRTNVNLRNNEGRTALHLAAQANSLESVSLILSRSPRNINAQEHAHGWTALHYAASSGNTTITAALLRAGANPNTEDNHGRTPLDLALEFENVTLSNLLELYGATSAADSSDESASSSSSSSDTETSEDDNASLESYLVIDAPPRHALTLRSIRSSGF